MPTAIRPATDDTSIAVGTAKVYLNSGPTCPRLSGRVGRAARPRILDVLIEPVQAFGEDVEQRLARGVAVRFVRQHDEADDAAVAFDRREQTLGVDRIGARVVIGFA